MVRLTLALEQEVRANHIRPATELAERVLLPGDPGQALAVAQALLETPPKMFNHARGLWGYTGIASDGEPLTVQATGMGGPERGDRVRGADRARRDPARPDRDLRSARPGARARHPARRGVGAPRGRHERRARRRRPARPRCRSARAARGRRRAPRDRGEQRPLLRPARGRGRRMGRARRAGRGDGGGHDPAGGRPARRGRRLRARACSNGARRMDAEELAELGVRVGEAGYAAVRSP